MTQPAEQFLASAKTAVADFNDIAVNSLAGFEKLVELNIATAKTALADTTEQLQAVLSAKSPQDLTPVTELVQPLAEKAAAYGRAVAAIVNETGAALTKAAEAKFAEAQAQAVASIEAALKQAPAGSDAAVAAFKSALSAGQKAFETAQASTKQAVDALEKNVAAATDAVTKAAKPAAKAK